MLINFEDLASQVSNNITINGLSVENSTIAVMRLTNQEQSKDIDQNIVFNDVSIINNHYNFQTSVIAIEDVESNQLFNIKFNRFTIRNLTFDEVSIILSLGHQSNEKLEINQMLIEDLKFGRIHLKVHDQTSELDSKVRINNITALNVDASLK